MNNGGIFQLSRSFSFEKLLLDHMFQPKWNKKIYTYKQNMCPDLIYLSEQGYSGVVSRNIILRTPEKKNWKDKMSSLRKTEHK